MTIISVAFVTGANADRESPVAPNIVGGENI
jgi:hypothetical protein